MEAGSFGSLGAQGWLQMAFRSGKWEQAYSVSGGYKRSDGGTENSGFEKGQGYANLSLSYDRRLDIGRSWASQPKVMAQTHSTAPNSTINMRKPTMESLLLM